LHLSDEYSKGKTINTYWTVVSRYLHFVVGEVGGAPIINFDALDNRIRKEAPLPPDRTWRDRVLYHELWMDGIPKLRAYFEVLEPPTEDDSFGRRLTALRDTALFWTLYETAARTAEVGRLTRSDFAALKDGRLVSVKGKGNRPHVLRLLRNGSSRAVPALGAYLSERTDTNEALFVSHSRNSDGKRLSVTSIYNAIKRPMRTLGLDGRVTPHHIRHYRAATMLQNGVGLEAVQEILNHVSAETTRESYAYFLPEYSVDSAFENGVIL
jgi:integrase